MENIKTSNNSNLTSLVMNGNVSSIYPEFIKNSENVIKNDNTQISEKVIDNKSNKDNQVDSNDDDDDSDDEEELAKSKILFVKVLLFLRTKVYQNLKKVKI